MGSLQAASPRWRYFVCSVRDCRRSADVGAGRGGSGAPGSSSQTSANQAQKARLHRRRSKARANSYSRRSGTAGRKETGRGGTRSRYFGEFGRASAGTSAAWRCGSHVPCNERAKSFTDRRPRAISLACRERSARIGKAGIRNAEAERGRADVAYNTHGAAIPKYGVDGGGGEYVIGTAKTSRARTNG